MQFECDDERYGMGGGIRSWEQGMRCSLDTERETGNEVQSGYGTRNRDGRREWQNMVCPMQNRGGGLKRENKKPAQQQNRQGTVPGSRRGCCRALR